MIKQDKKNNNINYNTIVNKNNNKIRKMLRIILAKVGTRILICLGVKRVRNETKYDRIRSLG